MTSSETHPVASSTSKQSRTVDCANAAAALMAMGLGQHLNDAVVACARAWAACESYERAKTRLESLFVRAGTLDGAVEGLRD